MLLRMPRSRTWLLGALAAATTLSLAPLTGLALASPADATGAARQSAAAQAVAPAVAESRQRSTRIKVQLLALNDFHGQLEPSTSSSSGAIAGTPAGGAEYLATHLRELRARAARHDRTSLTVAAGDLIGATPLVSAAFHDEPTIEAMNKLGLQVSSVGNHEFDEGWRELVRMQKGGCLDDGEGEANQNSCPDGSFGGARFQYLSANVRHTDTGRTVFPSVSVQRVEGVRVAFIGMTLQDTPNIVTRSGVEGLWFGDEVRTANRVAKRLDRRGIKSIVVLVHEGGFPTDPAGEAYDACPGMSGAILDINKGLSPRIDAVVSGHTHQAYKCLLEDPNDDRRLVTSASSLGRLVSDIRFGINRRTGEVVRSSERATNRIVTRDVPKAAGLTRLIDTYTALADPIASKVIGHLAPGTTKVTREPDVSGESPLGNLIADSQRADVSTVSGAKTPEIAFMNPGGIRSDLLTEASGDVTFGAAFSVQPFNNYLVSMDLTGAQILALLEEQWSGDNATKPRFLQVSGITYSYARAGTTYTLRPETVRVNGAALDPTRTYRVVANSFLSDGGDGFTTFTEAGDKYVGGLDIDALAGYLADNDPYTATPTDRISVAP